MPDMMNLRQPHHAMLMPRPIKESPRPSYGFPEYLKHTDVLGDRVHPLKLTASNSLFHSVLKGRVRGTRMLLERGGSVNGRNDYGYSILTAALHVDDDKRRGKLFKMLLDRGADPHFKDSTYDRSVLHWACVLGRTEQVQMLLDEVGGDLNLQDKDVDSHTALHHAVMAGHMAIVTRLVDMHRKFGVSVDIPDKLGLTPYLHAKRMGYRDVAQYLHHEGQASLGHGDMLFRTPREWSQIGKFERQKAIEIQTQEFINCAKIKGKITHVRQLEDNFASPRMAMPNIVLPSYSPDRDKGVKLAIRHGDRMSRSLPSLKEDSPGLTRGHYLLTEPGMTPWMLVRGTPPAHAPGPAKEAFINGPIPSQGVPSASAHAGAHAVPEGPFHGTPEGTGVPVGETSQLLSPRKGPGSVEAFALMGMHEKGRHARHYRQSQFDETKASEYKHIMGNLNTIMEILSEQTSKSFRQSVKYQRPETPKKKKPKNKVSSWPSSSGGTRGGRKGSKRSPKASAKKKNQSSATPRKEKGASAKKGSVGDEKHSHKAQHAEKAAEKKRAVPLLKVNDKIV